MTINLKGINRQSIRLKGYDYASDGVYYITICTQDRMMCFGEIVDGEIHLSNLGEMVHRAWCEIPKFDSRISLDEFIVMPNHLHGIIVIDSDGYRARDCGGGRGWDPAPTIPIHRHRVGRWRATGFAVRFQRPLIKPCVSFSDTRLSDSDSPQALQHTALLGSRKIR